MKGKRVQFDDKTWAAIDLLRQERRCSLQQLADEAFRDFLTKQDVQHDLKLELPIPELTGTKQLPSSLPIALSAIAVLISMTSIWLQYFRNDLELSVLLAHSYVRTGDDISQETLLGTYTLTFFNTGNRPAMVNQINQQTYRLGADEFNNIIDYLKDPQTLRGRIASVAPSCKIPVNRSYVVPKGILETTDAPIIIKAGEIEKAQFTLTSPSVPKIEIEAEKEKYALACLHIEFVTADGIYRVKDIPAKILSFHLQEDGKISSADTYDGLFYHAVDLMR